MYESNVGSTGKANELFIDSSSQPAWVAVCKSRTAKVGTEKCLVHTRTVISSVFPDITRLRLRKLCNQCVPEIKVLRFIHL